MRVTKSGLGCGTDWPHCHGKLIPSLARTTVAIEFSHRFTAGVVGVFVIALAVLAWLKVRNQKSVFWPAFLTLGFFPLQAWIGRQVVKGELRSSDVVLHFCVSVTLLGLLVLTTANARMPRRGKLSIVAVNAMVVATMSLVVLVVGAFVSQFHAALVFPDWPLMGGRFIPKLSGQSSLLHFLHRLAALLLGVTTAHLVVRLRRENPRRIPLERISVWVLALWFLQVGLGALNVFFKSAPWTVVMHVTFGALYWASALWLTVAAYRSEPVSSSVDDHVPARKLPQVTKAYFLLTKPRIIELLVITTVPAMVLAERGWPSMWLIAATILGGSLAAGSANSINCYLDRDIDEKMERTSGRPLPRHQVEPKNALRFGLVLGIAGFAWLALTVNMMAAVLAVAAILFYVFIYTMFMKRKTPSNIVIGGAAGAVPVLVGWAAVTGGVGRAAWVMFAIIFYWTPPHFWALSLRYAKDYAAAGVPMLPVVRGVTETTRQILLYSCVLFSITLLLYPLGSLGIIYLATATVMGIFFIAVAVKLAREPNEKNAMKVFHSSISYLVLLFVSIAVDRLVGAPQLRQAYSAVLGFSAVVFLIFEGAIVLSVVGYRRKPLATSASPRLVAEVVWTAIPLVAVAGLFLLAWTTGSLALP